MKHSIFYSWQSDLPGATTRNFIEDALKRALKSIRQDETSNIDPVLDRDTQGVPGSPSISDSIFSKISLASVFVADISIINCKSSDRPTPNPNVLVELGFAIAQIGWDRVLLVQNTVFGLPEDLPFDLRSRRIITYNIQGDDSKKTEKGLLQGRLENALKNALGLSDNFSICSSKDVALWWGRWDIDSRGLFNGGSLFIYDVGPSGFLFKIEVFNGMHDGEVSAYAHMISVDCAYARFNGIIADRVCEIVFRRKIANGIRIIEVDEEGNCSCFRGMGAVFAGIFLRQHERLFDNGVLDELDLRRLYSIMGKYYESFMLCFQVIMKDENLDQLRAEVTSGAPRGMFTAMEGILMRGSNGEIWAAFINEDVVRYFTTEDDYRTNLPITIRNWASRFPESEIVFHGSSILIPKEFH